MDNTLQQTLNVIPSTPKGAAAIGLPKDSIKMYGTPPQKQNQLNQNLTQNQVVKQEAKATPNDVAALDNSMQQRLMGVAGLQGRVSSFLDQRIQAGMAQEAQLKAAQGLEQTKADAVNKYFTDSRAALGDPAKLNKAYTDFADSLRAAGIPDPTQFMEQQGITIGSTMQGAATQGFKSNLQTLVGGDIGTALNYQGGTTQLLTDLGVTQDQLNNMTVDDLEAKIEDVKQQQFNKIKGLQAEALVASGNRKAEIYNELKALGQGGQIAQEAEVRSLQDQLMSADTVSFAGQSMTIDQLMSSDKISNVIEQAVLDDKKLQELAVSEPELAAWVTRNKANLEDLVGQTTTARDVFTADQEQFAKDVAGFDTELLQTLTGKTADDLRYVSSEEKANILNSVGGSSILQASRGNTDMALTIKNVAKNSPADMEKLKNLSAEQITKAYNLSNEIAADPTLGKWFKNLPEFITPEIEASILERKRIAEKSPSVLKNDDRFIEAIDSGDLDETDIEYLNSIDPKQVGAEFKQYTDWKDKEASLKNVTDLNSAISYLFGSNVSPDAINQQMKDLEASAAFDPKDKARLDTLRKYFGNNGVDESDVANIKNVYSEKFKTDVSDVMKNNIGTTENVAYSPNNLAVAIGKNFNDINKVATVKGQALVDMVNGIRNRGGLETSDIDRLGEEAVRMLMATGMKGVSTKAELDINNELRFRQNKRETEAAIPTSHYEALKNQSSKITTYTKESLPAKTYDAIAKVTFNDILKTVGLSEGTFKPNKESIELLKKQGIDIGSGSKADIEAGMKKFRASTVMAKTIAKLKAGDKSFAGATPIPMANLPENIQAIAKSVGIPAGKVIPVEVLSQLASVINTPAETLKSALSVVRTGEWPGSQGSRARKAAEKAIGGLVDSINYIRNTTTGYKTPEAPKFSGVSTQMETDLAAAGFKKKK